MMNKCSAFYGFLFLCGCSAEEFVYYKLSILGQLRKEMFGQVESKVVFLKQFFVMTCLTSAMS